MTKPLTIKEALAFKDGQYQPGSYLISSDDMTADQAGWDELDPAKYIDFSSDPYWITTDDGMEPESIRHDQDFASFQDVTGED